MSSGTSASFPLKVHKALVLCSHTDDEWGCAGTIIRLLSSGAEVRYIALSKCEESVPAPYPPDVLVGECMACTAALGIPPGNVQILDFRVRRFPEQRQEILEMLVAVRKAYGPDLVLVHSTSDTHQDHATLCAESFRAFKQSTILGYELPQNVISFENSVFVSLSEEILDRKVDALQAYESQASRPYTTRDFVKGLARVRGVQINCQYAEAYEAIRLVLI